MAQDEKKKRHFFKDFKAELKKVIWPTPKQIINGTIAVITIVLIVAAIVAVLDLTFKGLSDFGVHKVEEAVNKRQNTINEGTPSEVDNSGIEENTDENIPTDPDVSTDEDGENAE